MAGAPKSRWADSAEDVAAAAKKRKEKEEKKKKLKAARREAEAAQKATEAEAAARIQAREAENGADTDGRPTKRRKTTPPDRGSPLRQPPPRPVQPTQQPQQSSVTETTTPDGGHGLLRLGGGSLSRPCRSVERYDKLNDIEEGAYGWVARARDTATGEVVALKRLKLDAKDRQGLPVTGLREIQLLKDCSHRNIVQMREVVVGDKRPIESIFLVLEFVEHDLKSILEDMPQPFLASEVKTLLRQLAAGVAYLHGRHILHRDLKTSNLLLNNRGQLKIADFGMARYWGDIHPETTSSGPTSTSAPSSSAPSSAAPPLTALVVTLWYRAPELLLGERRYGAAVDLWSIGCIFGELLTREPLLQGTNEADELVKIFQLTGLPTDTSWPGFRRLPNARALKLPDNLTEKGPVPLRARFPLLTNAGCDLLGRLLSLDPARRPTADQMLDHEYFKQDPRAKQEAMFPTFPSKAGQERRRRRATPNAPVRGGAAAAMDLGAVDFAGIFSGREKEERGAGFSLRMV